MVESKKDNLLSQTQIANKLKVSQATVTRIIKNNGIEPTSTKGRSKLFSSEQVEFIRSYVFHRNENRSSNADNPLLSFYFHLTFILLLWYLIDVLILKSSSLQSLDI